MKLPKSSGKRSRPKLPFVRRVNGASMLPQYRAGQLVVAWPAKRMHIGDCIIVSHEGMEKLKRITAIKKDLVFVVGDNNAASRDSRHFGWIAAASIQGKIIWPLKRL